MEGSSLDEVQLVSPKRISRRSFLRRAGLSAGLTAVGLASYSRLIEPNEVEVKKIEIRLHRLSPAFDGFKIGLISDFHFGPFTGAGEISAAVRKVNELRADLVAMLGDFVSEPLSGEKNAGAKKAGPCAEVLSGVRSELGSFAILGNHDYITDPDFVADALRSHGISVLRNASHLIERNGARLWMLGVNDAIFSDLRIEQALAGIPETDPKILLVHEPDYADEASRYGIDVQFSGHSHGGQICIPGLQSLWLPPLGSKYYRGYYRVGGMQLYTNRGIGTIILPFRFCSPPEVTLVTLRAALEGSGSPSSASNLR